MSHIAFTGTRQGMSTAQMLSFTQWVEENHLLLFRHGACRGADTEAVAIIKEKCPDIFVVAHPGVSARIGSKEERSQLAIELSDQVYDEEGHFARNRIMVNLTNELVATPWQTKEQEPAEGQGGGTWYTIQYAIKLGKSVTIIWPNGEMEQR